MRSDGDQWGIEESVGTTALATAAIRADEALTTHPLFTDPYAQLFLDAARDRGWQRPYSAASIRETTETDAALGHWMTAMTNWTLCRTKFFDDFLLNSSPHEDLQVVILAAGLDARVWRMVWPSGTVVFELDQPGVLEFKAATLFAHSVKPTVNYVPVSVDLRDDWVTVLQDNGFDALRPTAWTIEGLLPYLSPAAQDRLFENIHAVSAPGSRLAVDAYTPEFYSQENMRVTSQRMTAGSASEDGIDPEQLLINENRADVADWLTAHGWSCDVTSALALMDDLARQPADGVDTTSMRSDFISAAL